MSSSVSSFMCFSLTGTSEAEPAVREMTIDLVTPSNS